MDARIALQPEFRQCLGMVASGLDKAEQVGRAKVLEESLKLFRKLHTTQKVRDPRFDAAISIVKSEYYSLIAARGTKNRVRILAEAGEQAGLGEFFFTYLENDITRAVRLLWPIGMVVQTKVDVDRLGMTDELRDFLCQVQAPLLATGIKAAPLTKSSDLGSSGAATVG